MITRNNLIIKTDSDSVSNDVSSVIVSVSKTSVSEHAISGSLKGFQVGTFHDMCLSWRGILKTCK